MAKLEKMAFYALQEMLNAGMIVSFEDADEVTVYPYGHFDRKTHSHFRGENLATAIIKARKAVQHYIDENISQKDIG